MTHTMLDIIIAVILLLSTLLAYFRGFIREVFTIIGLVAASTASLWGGPSLIPTFNKWLKVPEDGGETAAAAVSKGSVADPSTMEGMQAALRKSELVFGIASPGLVAKICAYGSIFLVVFIIMALISFFLSRIIKEVGLGVLDKLAGAAFGFVRGFLIIFLIYVPCAFLISFDTFPAWAKNSTSVPILQKAYVYANENLNLKEQIEKYGNNIADRVNKKHAESKNNQENAEPQDSLTPDEQSSPED